MRQAGCPIMLQAGVGFWQLPGVCVRVCVRARPRWFPCVCVCEGVFVMILFCVSEMCPMEASCV